MIEVKAFEAEITDFADIFINTSRGVGRLMTPVGDEPFLFVVLPSFAFKVKLTQGNLRKLREDVDGWLDLYDN